MHICWTCIIHIGSDLITSLKYKLGILDNNFSVIFHLMVNMCSTICQPTPSIKPMFFGDKSKFQELKQRQEIFIIYHGLTFIQQAKNSGKLDKFSFVFNYLTKIKLLEDSYWR